MSDLIAIENSLTASEIFKPNGADSLLLKIKEEVKKFTPDMTTAKGRKEIASMAHRVAKSKTYLDALGKDLVSEWKENSKRVDGERRKIRDELDKLKEEVRKPLTDWENAEKERVERAKNFISGLTAYTDEYDHSNTSADVSDALVQLKKEKFPTDLNEFKDTAETELKNSLLYLEQLQEQLIEREREQAELERLRKEEEIRKQKEREEQIRKEAEEKAKREAEEKAEKERQAALERERALAREKEIEEKRRIEAEERAERERLAAIQREKEIQERAKREKEEAIAAEKKRQEIEAAREAEKERKRKADERHRETINQNAIECLTHKLGLDRATAAKVIESISREEIENVFINY